MKMTVKYLRKALEGVPDEATVLWQANEDGEYNDPEIAAAEGFEVDEEPSFVFACGYAYSAFARSGNMEFVIDGAVTEREG